MTKKVTPRQLEALESLLVNHTPHMKRDDFYKTGWTYVRTGGGSKAVINDALVRHGFRRGHLDRLSSELGKNLGYHGYQITASGLQYLIENSKDAAVIEKAKAKLPEMLKAEAAFKAAYEAERAERNKRYAEAEQRRRKAHMTELRRRLGTYGLGEFAASKSDDDLLAFARDIEGAEYGRPEPVEEELA